MQPTYHRDVVWQVFDTGTLLEEENIFVVCFYEIVRPKRSTFYETYVVASQSENKTSKRRYNGTQ